MRISDWSSDVCSSDLIADFGYQSDRRRLQIVASFRNNLVQIIGLERTTILPIPTRKNQRGGKPPSRIDEEQRRRSEEHTSELQSLMRISYADFCLKKKKSTNDYWILL